MGQTMRVSLPGYDAGTDTNLDHFALYADTDNVLIKEKVRGTSTLANGATGTIIHSLGYVPTTLAFVQSSAGRWAQVLSDPVGTYSKAVMAGDGTNIYLTNYSGGTATFKYIIFYDQQI